MSSITPSPIGPATAARRGTQSAAHFTKLDALPANAALEARFSAIETAYPAADAVLAAAIIAGDAANAASIAALTTAAVPDSSNRRYVTDAQSTVIGNTSGTNTGDVTLPATVGGWLSLAGQALTFALVAATTGVSGVVTAGAQILDGVKTFAAKIIAAAGIELYGVADPAMRIGTGNDSSSSIAFYSTANAAFTAFTSRTFVYSRNASFNIESSTGVIKAGGNQGLGPTDTHFEVSGAGSLRGPLGASSGDLVMKIGSTVADASVHSLAKLLSLRTGIGGTEVEKAYFEKSGSLVFATAAATRIQWGTGANTWQIEATPNSGVMRFGNNSVTYFGLRLSDGYGVSAYGFEVNPSGSQATVQTSANGTRIDQRGVDRRGVVLGNDSPGAQAMGINRLQSGSTTCVITTTQATLASHVEITWLADPGARHWVTLASGSFTVNLSAAPGSNVDFSWRISGLV